MPGARVLARIAVMLASVALVLGTAELLARAFWHEVEHRPLEKPASELPTLSGRDLHEANVAGLAKGVFYRTNAAALRGPDYDRQPPPGTFRIAVVGDSVVAGAGVDERDTYPLALQALLETQGMQHADTADSFQVINMGLGGLRARAVMNRLVRASDFYEFQLAIYGWTPNDIEGRHYQPVGHKERMVHWKDVLRFQDHPSVLVRTLWPRLLGLRARLRDHDVTIDDEVRFNYLENPKAFAAFEAELDAFTSFTRERGICGHLFIHSRRQELLEVHDLVASAAQARGLSVSRAMPAFEGRRPEDFWLSPFDSHHNVEGNALMARALYDGLRDTLPPECWRVQVTSWPRAKRRQL